jgi:hypothetical protein
LLLFVPWQRPSIVTNITTTLIIAAHPSFHQLHQISRGKKLTSTLDLLHTLLLLQSQSESFLTSSQFLFLNNPPLVRTRPHPPPLHRAAQLHPLPRRVQTSPSPAAPIATMSSTSNSWLRNQRKSDLVEIAKKVGLENFETFKKTDLEVALDDYLEENSSRFSSNPDVSGYFNSRSKAMGSPVKKEAPAKDEAASALKVVKRRVTKAAEDISNAISHDSSEESRGSSTALVQTPGRSLSLAASRIPLPATPADLVQSVDRQTAIVRQRVNSIYQESGITEASNATRDALSTVTSVIFFVSAFELFFIREEVLSNRYAFTIPAVHAIGTSDYPIYLPDMFLVLTASFWSPALTWFLTSFVLPSMFGYFFNLSAQPPAGPRTRSRAAALPEYTVDPLTFSIAKAIISFVVYGQGVTLGGLLSEVSIERLNNSVYGGYAGILTGTAVTSLVSIYDAVLRK